MTDRLHEQLTVVLSPDEQKEAIVKYVQLKSLFPFVLSEANYELESVTYTAVDSVRLIITPKPVAAPSEGPRTDVEPDFT